MALTQGDLKSMLTSQFPSTHPSFATLSVEAIRNAVAYAADKGMREYAEYDWVGDGVTRRVALPGRDVLLAVASQQTTPTAVDTAGIVAPTTAATVTADATSGTFAAGKHYLTYAYQTPRGITQAVRYTTVTVAAAKSLKIGALANIPSDVTGVPVYIGVAPLDPDVRQVGTLIPSGGATAATVYSAPGVTTNARPLVEYTALSTLSPNDTPLLEGGFGTDGQPSALATTLTVGTALSLGARTRITYWRRPLAPTADGDTIGLPDAFLRIGAHAFMAQLLELNHVSGDASRFGNAFKEMDAILIDLSQTAKARPRPRLNLVEWT